MAEDSFDAFFRRLKSVSSIQNQSQLAEHLQVGRANISLAKYKDKIPSKWIFQLSEEFNLNSDWLARGKGSPFPHAQTEQFTPSLVKKVHSWLTAEGELHVAEDSPLRFDPELLKDLGSPEHIVAFTARDKAMSPEIKEGDLLLVDRSVQAIYPCCTYALGVEGWIIIRRVEKLPRSVLIFGDNPEYPSREIELSQWESLKVLGRLMMILRRS